MQELCRASAHAPMHRARHKRLVRVRYRLLVVP
jgi:hypothetical protein